MHTLLPEWHKARHFWHQAYGFGAAGLPHSRSAGAHLSFDKMPEAGGTASWQTLPTDPEQLWLTLHRAP